MDLLPSFLKGWCCCPVNRRPTTLRYACTTAIMQICKAPKPFVLVLLQTRSSPRCCKAMLVLPVNKESHRYYSSYAKPKPFLLRLLRQLTPCHGLWTIVSELEFRRFTFICKCSGLRNHVVAKMDLQSVGVRSITKLLKVLHVHCRDSHRRRGEVNVFDLESRGSGSAPSVFIKFSSSLIILRAAIIDTLAFRCHER
jgi:hypothetical protein